MKSYKLLTSTFLGIMLLPAGHTIFAENNESNWKQTEKNLNKQFIQTL